MSRESVPMGKEETLLKLKETEAQIRAAKDTAEKDRDRVLREARREALEVRDRLREQAEARYREIVAGAEASVKKEREKILATGREEAARMTAKGRANVDRAVELVLGKFEGARHA